MLPPSPLQLLRHPAALRAGVTLYCKRDDQYAWDPGSPLQGNKVRKLWPLLSRGDGVGRSVVSFGGAFSNHVAALAAAGARLGFSTRLFIRGEPVDNPTLRSAVDHGAELHFLSRTDYRRKDDPLFLRHLGVRASDVVIPEGGSGAESLTYAGKAFSETVDQLGGRPPDHFCLSAGTGGTAAGVIVAAAGTPCTVEVFPALRGDWMGDEISRRLAGYPYNERYRVITAYHFGGYGRFSPDWRLYTPPGAVAKRADIGEEGLPELEPVYTAKLFHGVLDRIRAGVYSPGATIVVLHTGGIY
ncbi:1-aminocyclopropane-1-carboxylate deaminase/D-cysteine desulfhydrase [Lewinella sp. JB7]|uniref:1-aminocyclopropane-1-carboxylate deaminase/D-cysteine desulfhydrase n=1 Tax=Lewinella sp. JB7 TaxID=2962887 RepID=UPI0020C9CA27|nr:pyridoxal-phosphate dependent enzyme [Lewinella sp. JB7]MCP9237827.1 pyridoxal-phosphate dependent enzyme [Lewinella sp. JB7]